LGLSSKLHAGGSANLLRLLLEGGGHASGSMPGFAEALDDRQVADLARYLRARFAPGQPEWTDVDTTLKTVRATLAP